MKAERGEKLFTPITIEIESQAELDYLYTLSNTSTAEAKERAKGLTRLSSKYVPDSQTGDALFQLISKFYD